MSSAQSVKKVDQKEYLKKYLSGGKVKKKKKDKNKTKLKTSMKIIDDDVQENTNVLSIDEELLLMGEDAPQIVGTWVEEEPVIRSSIPKWKSIVKTEIKTEPEDDNNDNFSGGNVSIDSKSLNQTENNKEMKNTFKSDAVIRGKSFDTDLSPIRSKVSQPDSDNSPPRRKTNKKLSKENSFDSDQSPPRKKYGKTSRFIEKYNSPSRRKHGLLSDRSSPKKTSRRSVSNQSPHRKNERQSPRRRYSDESSQRKREKRKYEISPDRGRKNHSPERIFKKAKSPSDCYNSSNDQSPPRRSRSKQTNKPRKDSDGRSSRFRDITPPVRIKLEKLSPDLSPPRKSSSSNFAPQGPKQIKKEPLSPSRKNSPPHRRNKQWRREKSHSLSPPPTHKPKPSKTLEGKRAGLQDSKALEKEIEERRNKEDKFFEKLSADISGRDAQIQVRSTGRSGRWRGRDIEQEDPEAIRLKEEQERKRKEKYDRWGKGLKQIEDHQAKLQDDMYEASKPLARYADDEDLDRLLREKEHPDDPMLEYMRKKKREQQKDIKIDEPKIYKGPYPPNRFGIRPGYRWDGVDRSNGFEKKWFDTESEKIAIRAEAYKYSVEDM